MHPEDPNLFVTAGWDQNLKIYDVRQREPIDQLYGPIINGDSLDIFEDLLVVGNDKNKENLMMYCLSQRKRVNTWEFNQNQKDAETGFLYATRFSNDGNFVFAGGAGKNELKVFANNSDSSATFKLQMEICNLPSPVYCIDTNPDPNLKQFAFGLRNGLVYICNYDYNANSEDHEPYLGNISMVAKEQKRQEQRDF
mmetsp:Transcript_14436/g.24630  ORF Transcript_14436/g.24630 Transcript_14436/m.24630 type:complete len:196 (+) Transcript_14436:729-1316(+)